MKIGTFSVGDGPMVGLLVDGRMVSAVSAMAVIGDQAPIVGGLREIIESGPTTWDRLEDLSVALESEGLHVSGEQRWWWPASQVRFHAPFSPPKNPWTVGSNYAAHIEIAFKRIPREFKLPELPEFFTKALTSVCGDGDDVIYDRRATQTVDYENELMIVIGVGGKDIPVDSARDHVFGYCVANDVSARELQIGHGQFFRGKSQTGFCPFGPVISTKSAVPDPNSEHLRTWVNGELRQDWPVGDMVFTPDEIVSSLSQGMTIEPGDVILCGTAPGVGFEFLPQRWLQHGDVVECEISGIGRIRNTIKMAGV
jgi:2-keto-4-pentenoate hydratase/2-oxohepta-3-ene-1,7-dioic acid hydratase in catechol pathway